MSNRFPWLGALLFYSLLVYAGLLLFSVNYLPIVPGLDPSWAFALNQFAHGPELFGRDLILTYGPLAYLAVPQHVGQNIQIAAWVHVLVWSVLMYLLLMLWESGQKFGAFIFTVSLVLSNRLYYHYWDYFLDVVVIVALLLLMRKPASISVLIIVAAVTGLTFLVKFTAFILAILLFGVYLISRGLRIQHVGIRERALLLLVIVSGPLFYLIYNPSLMDLAGYLRGSLAMSSGYSEAMSMPVTADLGWRAAILCGALALCAGVFAARRWLSPAGAVMILIAEWVAFKHGYVRSEPTHAGLFFCFMILLLGFCLAQMNFTLRRAAVCGAIFAAFSGYALQGASQGWGVTSRDWWSPGFNLAQAGRLLHWRQTARMLDQINDDTFRGANVMDYLGTLKHSRVLFFPWEVSNGSRGAFTTVPLYATQAYSAYTHFLDEQSAKHIAEASPAIDYVLFEWGSVDRRNPFLDVPMTWNELFRHFIPASARGDVLLLHRRPSPLPVAFHAIAQAACPFETWTAVPARNTPVALSLDLHQTLTGKAITTLFQLDAINMEVQTRSGLSVEMRFPPGVVQSPFPINYLPLNGPILTTLWNENLVADPIVRLRLTGPGLRQMACGGMQFYDVTGTQIRVL